MGYNVPEDHPRRESILIRERLVEGFHKGLVCEPGLIAQGRGEAFDYLLGETTARPAKKAIKAAAAALVLAKNPVISVNGNLAALCPGEAVSAAKAIGAKLEVNLFYRTEGRARKIGLELKKAGALKIYGVEDATRNIVGLGSERGKTSPDGIYSADLVIVSVEDGDRTEALVKMGKKVVAIDLNPLARTSEKADITIVDNVMRAFPALEKEYVSAKSRGKEAAQEVLANYDNGKTLKECITYINSRLKKLAGSEKEIRR